MLLESVLPRDSGRSPPPNGRKDSESEKKKRAEILSCPPRNSRSQFVVNWSSVYLPGRLIAKAPKAAGSPLGIKKPLEAPPNWLLLKFRSLLTTGSIAVVVFPKNAFEMDASERSAGSVGSVELMKVPGERPLRWRVPW